MFMADLSEGELQLKMNSRLYFCNLTPRICIMPDDVHMHVRMSLHVDRCTQSVLVVVAMCRCSDPMQASSSKFGLLAKCVIPGDCLGRRVSHKHWCRNKLLILCQVAAQLQCSNSLDLKQESSANLLYSW